MPRAPSVSRLRKVSLLGLLLASVLFGACAHITDDQLGVALKGPRKKPLPIVTHFSKALHCMDQKLLEYGVWDKRFLITDIIDNTQAVPVGASDMLITAIAQMGKRSGAVTIIPNSGPNLVELLKDNPPDYYIRGSITQYDRDFLVEEFGVGFSWAEYLGLGYGEGERVSAVGVDLHVAGMKKSPAVFPEAISKIMIPIYSKDRSFDIEISSKKAAANAQRADAQNEPLAQAVRTLLELASIELVARKEKVPFWSCIDADLKDPEVQRAILEEIEIWYRVLRREQALTDYVRRRLNTLGYDTREMPGHESQEFERAVRRYRAAHGLPSAEHVDLALFTVLVEGPTVLDLNQGAVSTSSTQVMPAGVRETSKETTNQASRDGTAVTNHPHTRAQLGLRRGHQRVVRAHRGTAPWADEHAMGRCPEPGWVRRGSRRSATAILCL